MPVNVPRMRCQSCRMWIDAPRTATVLPWHTASGESSKCPGTGKPPAERRGPQ